MLRNTRELREMQLILKELKEKEKSINNKNPNLQENIISKNKDEARFDRIHEMVDTFGYDLSIRILRSNLF